MSTEKDPKKPLTTPLKENEAGQIEGGFSELAASLSPDEDALNALFCGSNISCKPSTTAPPAA